MANASGPSKFKMGVAAIYDSEEKVLHAAKSFYAQGFRKFDAISPYPIHGMEEACGIKRSMIPWVTFGAGAVGLTCGLLLTWWTSAVNWPINVGGKPYFSLPAFIPIVFELTILFAAHSSVAALFVLCGLPKKQPPVIDLDLTCHKFAIFVPEEDFGFEFQKVEALMKSTGAESIKKTEF